MSAEYAYSVLGELLDMIERQSEDMRVKSVNRRLSDAFDSAEARETFNRIMEDAERCFSVRLTRRKEARHLLVKVTLRDSERLYSFLGRVPMSERVNIAETELLQHHGPETSEGRTIRDLIIAGWRDGKRPFGISVNEVEEGAVFLRCIDKLILRDPSDRSDIRTFSRRATGNTKTMERCLGQIATAMKRLGRFEEEVDDADVLAALGLLKFQPPVLVAGPLIIRGIALEDLTFVGLSPEDATAVAPSGVVRAVVTIENLASFNRYVREARTSDEVVLYTGGFPSRAVMACLGAISIWYRSAIHHWGDIDPYGIRIALHMARNLPLPVVPHLMDVSLARRFGTPTSPVFIDASFPAGDPWLPLTRFFSQDGARILEQEELDPVHVPVERNVEVVSPSS
jgi:hypothetical protein